MKNITYINAGAGSGKTYTLTNILAEKLAEKDDKGQPVIKPSQVILTTFTELAADEFREKARQQLLEGNQEKGIASNVEAATQIDSASIGTVHSVALGFIKKFWYLLDYGADIQPISERDADFYMSQSLTSIVNHPKHAQDLENFRKFRDYYDICNGYGHPDYLFWQRDLYDVVEKMDYYDVTNVQMSIDKSIETLKKVFNKDYALDYDFIEKAIKEYQGFCDQQHKTPGDPGEVCSKRIENILKIEKGRKWFLEVQSMLSTPCSAKTAEKKLEHFSDLTTRMNEAAASKYDLDVLENYVRSIFLIAEEWRNDFIDYKRQNHIISYNDMERLFLRLLEKEQEVRDYVRNNYRLVMVDEFQDSNPIQLKIFNCLSELISPDGHSYWVGDPKQAIYGFRGADTDLVNSVSKHFTFYDDARIHDEEGENHLGSGRLVESWRSRDTLVHLVNEVFAGPFEEDGINKLLITLNPHFKNEGMNSDALVHWEITESNKGKAANALAGKVKELLDSKMAVHRGKRDEGLTEVSPKDIAILCRTNDYCKSVVKALRKYNVPVCEAEDAIMQRIEVQLLVTLLQFIQHPTNKHIIADLMRLLWGNTTEEILRERIDYVSTLKKEQKDEWMQNDTRVEELRNLIEPLKSLSVPEIVESLIYRCNLPALTERWGEAHLRRQNLSTVQHLAKDYDQMCLQMGLGGSINGFIYYLNTIEPDKEKDNVSDTVKVFTYHGSKGLEWPIVIMCELGTDALNDKDFTRKQFMKVCEVVSKDNATESDPFNKEYYLHFFPCFLKRRTGNVHFPPTVLDNITTLELFNSLKNRAEREERRLLYVGMTRAKDCLYTVGYKGNTTWLTNAGIQNSTPKNVWGLDDFKPLYIEISESVTPAATTTPAQYSIPSKPTKHSTREPQYLSPSKVSGYNGYNTHKRWTERGVDIPTNGWNKAEYSEIGSCIHDIFAVYQYGEHDNNYEKASRIINGYNLASVLSGHIDAILRSADFLYEQLNSRFPLVRTEREYPFTVPIPTGQVLRGEMDLLWFYKVDDLEHCVLVDYKSYPGVDFDKHTATHYAQLSAYADALRSVNIDVSHSLVYYPVHGVIHELL